LGDAISPSRYQFQATDKRTNKRTDRTSPSRIAPDCGGAKTPLMGTLKPQSNGPLYSNTLIGTLAVDGWAVTFGIQRGGACRAGSHADFVCSAESVYVTIGTPMVIFAVLTVF